MQLFVGLSEAEIAALADEDELESAYGLVGDAIGELSGSASFAEAARAAAAKWLDTRASVTAVRSGEARATGGFASGAVYLGDFPVATGVPSEVELEQARRVLHDLGPDRDAVEAGLIALVKGGTSSAFELVDGIGSSLSWSKVELGRRIAAGCAVKHGSITSVVLSGGVRAYLWMLAVLAVVPTDAVAEELSSDREVRCTPEALAGEPGRRFWRNSVATVIVVLESEEDDIDAAVERRKDEVARGSFLAVVFEDRASAVRLQQQRRRRPRVVGWYRKAGRYYDPK